MEPASDSRFDSNIAAQILISVAQEDSLHVLFERLVERAIGGPGLVCIQVWLVENDDRCTACPHRAGCPDPCRCLHLVAARTKSLRSSEKGPRPYEDLASRVPLGAPPLGEVVTGRERCVFLNVDSQMSSLPGMGWLREEGIREIAVVPIRFRGDPLGAVVGYYREDRPEETALWGRMYADHLGAAIANARAFEEIRRLNAQLELHNSYLQEAVIEAKSFGDLIGESAALRHIARQIDLVAPTEASVLILGETGTGKELVAHEIHLRSSRKNGPMVRVNCASIPRELFESEFFGHVKGSFTGAVKDRAGRFETAEGGTVFLDEVGEIPLDVQNKLLRVLQERCYERVGDDRTRRADVRIIAATNRDLKQAIAAGRFREDLYYRLNVFPIQVPPLRERREDIPLLATHFVAVCARDLKCEQPRLTRAAVAKLQDYDWPGNVRELRNVIERAVILARGGVLDFDLPGPSAMPATSLCMAAAPRRADAATGFLTEVEMQQRARENLRAALEQADWKIRGADGAAELLGIKPTTLLARMKKWGLRRPTAG